MQTQSSTVRKNIGEREESYRELSALVQHERRRLRLLGSLALLVLITSILLAGHPLARADDDDKNGLKHRVEALEALVNKQAGQISALQTANLKQVNQICALQKQVSDLQSSDSTQAGQISTLGSRAEALEDKTQYVSVVNGEMYIRGTNLHIENGTPFPRLDQFGAPLPPTLNGKGNLIIGFNASRVPSGGTDTRTGSHNLILGDLNDYSSYGGIVAGGVNSIRSPYASITGGTGNIAGGFASSISGGDANQATGDRAWIGGGETNTASGDWATISGGSGNTASAPHASVSGGLLNTASGSGASVSGGSGITEANIFGWWGGNFHSP